MTTNDVRCLIGQADCGLKDGETQCGKCGLRPADKFVSREDRDEAVKKAEQLYSQNHAECVNDLAESEQMRVTAWKYRAGDGVEQSVEQWFAWTEKAANAGAVNAMLELGEWFGGRGAPEEVKDLTKALSWFDRAEIAGTQSAYVLQRLGHIFAYGCYDIPQDESRAVKLFVAALQCQWFSEEQYNHFKSRAICALALLVEDSGISLPDGINIQAILAEVEDKSGADFRAQYWTDLAQKFEYQGMDGFHENPIKAFNLYLRAAEYGLVDAMCKVGCCYQYGEGIVKDFTKAFTWYQRANSIGSDVACYKLGYAYFKGEDVKQDFGLAREYFMKCLKCLESESSKYHFQSIAEYFLDASTPLHDEIQAAEFFRRAAESGSSGAMISLSFLLENGQGIDKNEVSADEWRRKAIESENHPNGAFAMSWIAQSYGHAWHGARSNPEKCAAWYLKAAEAGDVDSMLEVARGYGGEYGIALTIDQTKSLEWYEKAALAGNTACMLEAGRRYLEGVGAQKDPEKAKDWFEKIRAIGNSNSFVEIGKLYLQIPDLAKANEWFIAARATGNLGTLVQLGIHYRDEEPSAANAVLAFELFRAAAEGGDANAMRHLGFMYEDGRGTTKDAGQALSWLEKSVSSANDKKSQSLNCYQIALCYESGDGVTASEERAAWWYQRTSEMSVHDYHSSEAAYWLAIRLAEGRGVAKNSITAEKLFRHGASLSSPESLLNMIGKGGYFYRSGRSVDIHFSDDTRLLCLKLAAELGERSAKRALGDYFLNVSRIADDFVYGVEGESPIDEAEAFYWYHSASQDGDTVAMMEVADAYRKGRGLPKDEAMATLWVRKAADFGSVYGMRTLALSYLGGIGLQQDAQEADIWFERAADAGGVKAMEKIGSTFFDNHRHKECASRAFYWNTRAAEKGSSEAMWTLAKMYANGVCVEKNDAQADEWFEKYVALAGTKNGWHLLQVGNQYYTGQDVPRNDAKAFTWLRRAADNGEDRAMMKLAKLYATGRGVVQSDMRAVEWYRQAADAGNVEGMVKLGKAYSEGKGTVKNIDEALVWLQKVASGYESIEASYALGKLYATGNGVALNAIKALVWLDKAINEPAEYVANVDSARAAEMAGDLYFYGRGIEADFDKARGYYLKALRKSDKDLMFNDRDEYLRLSKRVTYAESLASEYWWHRLWARLLGYRKR